MNVKFKSAVRTRCLYTNCLWAITRAILDPNHFLWSVLTFLLAKFFAPFFSAIISLYIHGTAKLLFNRKCVIIILQVQMTKWEKAGIT